MVLAYGPFPTSLLRHNHFAPVCMRFNTYALPIPANIAAYVARVTALPSVQA
jgi:glutathione S-transferase